MITRINSANVKRRSLSNNYNGLKVLNIAPISLPVSRNIKYAGSQRVIDALNQTYHEQGLYSVVAATRDSDLGEYGTLFPTLERSLWRINSNGLERDTSIDPAKPYETHYRKSLDYAIDNDIDVIHDHPGDFIITSRIYSELKDELDKPIVITLHNNSSGISEDKQSISRDIQKQRKPVYFISISNSHKNKFERETGIEIAGVVYNGIPVEKYDLVEKDKKQDYLFWIGRICPDKGTDLAIQTAKKSGLPLIIAGEFHKHEQDFYKEKIEPYLTKVISGKDSSHIEREKDDLVSRIENGEKILNDNEIFFIGPLNDKQKGVVSGHSQSLLVLNRWEEPFGLVMPESMATGTPVIGTNLGAIPELVKDGSTGYVIPIDYINGKIDEESLIIEASKAVGKVGKISPAVCRKSVEKKFSRQSMADGYISLYNEILELPLLKVCHA